MGHEYEDWVKLNPYVQTLSVQERQTLYEELKRAGAVEIPKICVETHLKGGIEDEFEDKAQTIDGH